MTILYTVCATTWVILLIAAGINGNDEEDLETITAFLTLAVAILTILAIVSIELYKVLGGVG